MHLGRRDREGERRQAAPLHYTSSENDSHLTFTSGGGALSDLSVTKL